MTDERTRREAETGRNERDRAECTLRRVLQEKCATFARKEMGELLLHRGALLFQHKTAV